MWVSNRQVFDVPGRPANVQASWKSKSFLTLEVKSVWGDSQRFLCLTSDIFCLNKKENFGVFHQFLFDCRLICLATLFARKLIFLWRFQFILRPNSVTRQVNLFKFNETKIDEKCRKIQFCKKLKFFVDFFCTIVLYHNLLL